MRSARYMPALFAALAILLGACAGGQQPTGGGASGTGMSSGGGVGISSGGWSSVASIVAVGISE